MTPIKGFRLTVLSVLSLCCAAAAAFAQTPFYQGKTITILRGSAPGGVGEMRTRAVANYLKKHVPGSPTVVIEFMAGAGGTKAANHLYRGARTDGLIIGSAPSGMVSSALLGEGGIIPVAPAVANAVYWCTGARVKSLPLTPEKVWRAIKEVADERKESRT